MVPRTSSNSPRRRALNAISEFAHDQQELIATPTTSERGQSDQFEDEDVFEGQEEDEEEENIPVSEDNLMVRSKSLSIIT